MGDGWQHNDYIPKEVFDQYNKNAATRDGYTPKRNIARELDDFYAGWNKHHDPADLTMGRHNETRINCRGTIKKEKEMTNHNEAVTLIQLANGAQLFKAEYQEGGTAYSFKNVTGNNVEVGDSVVVQSREEFAVVKVTEVDVDPTDIGCGYGALKHLVCRVDLVALNKVLAREKQAAHKLAMSEVTNRLQVYKDQLGKVYDTVADSLLAPEPGQRREIGEFFDEAEVIDDKDS